MYYKYLAIYYVTFFAKTFYIKFVVSCNLDFFFNPYLLCILLGISYYLYILCIIKSYISIYFMYVCIECIKMFFKILFHYVRIIYRHFFGTLTFKYVYLCINDIF